MRGVRVKETKDPGDYLRSLVEPEDRAKLEALMNQINAENEAYMRRLAEEHEANIREFIETRLLLLP